MQAERIRKDIDAFTARVAQQRAAFREQPLFRFATGASAAYPLLDAAAAELAKLRREAVHFGELAGVFELADALAPACAGLGELREQLVAVKDVWDAVRVCESQFETWRGTLWSAINTEAMEDGAKSLVKEVKALPKKVWHGRARRQLHACSMRQRHSPSSS